ncbi:MAG: zinc ribbon domain-containing protein [Clostridiales Family XIII bacterium]|jgi:uncharacterized protein YxeA|nr:zinc ribbon domain-containing protein [Clostridiales Family XIII bacterium]
MALMDCPDCDREISDTCTKCPYCGYVFKSEPESKLGKVGSKILEFIGSLIALIIIGGLIIWYYDIDTSVITDRFQKYVKCDSPDVSTQITDLIKDKLIKEKLSDEAFKNSNLKLDLVHITKIDKDVGFCECKADLIIFFNHLDGEIVTPVTFSTTKSRNSIYYEVKYDKPYDLLELEDL